MINCDIYKGNKKAEMYLYVATDSGLEAVPEALIASFGKLELVINLQLTEARKLARVDVVAVMQALRDHGYYLQMPPSSWTESAGTTEYSA
jgi:uncharacterized protein YcgL (UPF0745 family)